MKNKGEILSKIGADLAKGEVAAVVSILLVAFSVAIGIIIVGSQEKPAEGTIPDASLTMHKVPDASTIPFGKEGELVKYGSDLIRNTAYYLGPNGKIAQISNGLNCQNCHQDAGTKAWGNNYFAVASTYPKFRERSGTIESIEKRVNDCFERSLNGKALNEESKEMRAIVAYVKWLGTGVPKGVTPNGTGIYKVPFLDRAASPEKGKLVYKEKCQSCHQPDGQGLKNPEGWGYTYPPLWGENSYNSGAGLYRLSRFAGYVKYNMPQGVNHTNPELTDEEAWDVAAYVNSQPRPSKDLSKDWPNIASKPIDHPFGPFADNFTEEQHKYGPFKPIEQAKKKNKK